MYELKEGTVLRNNEELFEATVTDIHPDDDYIDVIVTNSNGFCWHEEWVLTHTIAGIGRGDYVDVTPE